MTRPPVASSRIAASADVLHLPLTVPVPRGPAVLTLHDVLHHDLPEHFTRAERAFRRLAYDRAARHATFVITPTDHSRRRIVAALGIEPRRVIAIHSGVDRARFRPGPVVGDSEWLAGLALPPEPWLLYPAALWPHKNHSRLLTALAGCRSDVSLVLTGATVGREADVLAFAGDSLVRDRVRMLGHVPSAALPALYRAATAVVFPSLAEGFGQPPLEAMACGCPVAASDAGAIAEACGDAALVFPPRDTDAMATAMTRLATDGSLRAELRAAGLEHARRFTWERSAARHAEVYADALSNRS